VLAGPEFPERLRGALTLQPQTHPPGVEQLLVALPGHRPLQTLCDAVLETRVADLQVDRFVAVEQVCSQTLLGCGVPAGPGPEMLGIPLGPLGPDRPADAAHAVAVGRWRPG